MPQKNGKTKMRFPYLLLGLKITITLALLSSNTLYAAPNLLLQCLAREETQLHKEKAQGTLYRLNQEFINELASTNDITLKKKFVDEICQSHKLTPTVGLLRLLLLKESDLYDLSLAEVDPAMKPYKMGYINEFQKQVPRLFIQYVAGLQSEMATPDCLNKAIPELNILNDRLKYLEEEMTIHEVIRDKSRIEKIFSKLENVSAIKAKCEKIAMMRSKRINDKINQMKKKEGANL